MKQYSKPSIFGITISKQTQVSRDPFLSLVLSHLRSLQCPIKLETLILTFQFPLNACSISLPLVPPSLYLQTNQAISSNFKDKKKKKIRDKKEVRVWNDPTQFSLASFMLGFSIFDHFNRMFGYLIKVILINNYNLCFYYDFW